MSQQMLPLVGDGYPMSSSDLSGSGNIYVPGSTALLSASSQSLNPDMNFKSKANHGMLAHQTSLSSMQQTLHLKPQKLDSSQSMNFQITRSAQEQLVQSQQQMPTFQHQQFQQPNQPNAQLVQHPRYQHNHQLHQTNTDNLRRSSFPSNFAGQLLPEVGIESNNELFLPEVNEQFQLSELQNQYQQNSSSGNLSMGAQLLGQIQGPQNFLPLSSQQISQVEEQTVDSQNALSCLFAGSQTDLCQEHWNPQSQLKSKIQENIAFDPHIREEFHMKIEVKNEAQQPEISSAVHASIACGSLPHSNRSFEPLNPNRERDYFNQKRWLLLLLHSRKCPSLKGQCREANCIKVQQLWVHIERCESNNCMFPRCSQSKKLFNHYSACNAADCPVCNPVREFVMSMRAHNRRPSDTGLMNKRNGSWKNVKSPTLDKVVSIACLTPSETSDCQQSSSKRMKVEHPPTPAQQIESSLVSIPPTRQFEPPQERQFSNYEQVVAGLPCKSEVFGVKMDTSLVSGQFSISGSQLDDMPNKVLPAKTAAEPSPRKEVESYTKKEMPPAEKDNLPVKMESNRDASIPLPVDPTSISKSGKPKIKGVSLTELFTPEQIREHITSLRQWVGQVR